ncbi:hypothetical protein Trydic_g8524 [Trypoxylus dichotomus]
MPDPPQLLNCLDSCLYGRYANAKGGFYMRPNSLPGLSPTNERYDIVIKVQSARFAVSTWEDVKGVRPGYYVTVQLENFV